MKDAPASIESSRNRVDFEGGVHLGIGTFNLVSTKNDFQKSSCISYRLSRGVAASLEIMLVIKQESQALKMDKTRPILYIPSELYSLTDKQ